MASLLEIIIAMIRNFLFLTITSLSIACISCSQDRTNYSSPPGYDLSRPKQIKLPLELDEISGLSYYKKDTSVFAISDEKGWLYKIKLGGDHHIDRWQFAPHKADFEDVSLVDSVFYILQSKGVIHKVTFASGMKIQSQEFKLPYDGKDEFETIYYDDVRKKLILICKDCASDKKKALTTFAFDPATEQYSDTSFVIDVKDIDKALNVDKMRFKPSAAAINPIDNMLYIVSSVNKLLVITDRDGKFKKAYPLDPSLFKQPEGIAFAPNGAMIISNESHNIGVANILIFSFHKNPS